MQNIADFLFEIGILAKTPRSGFPFLGSGQQSVAEHLCRTAYVGYVLASLDGNADIGLTVLMCLFHDISEARTGDLNYVHQKYVQADERKALEDTTKDLPFAEHMKTVLQNFATKTSKEALLAKDADNIEWLLSLKEQADIGNKRAEEWMGNTIKRLKTEVAQKLAETICQTRSDHWYAEPESTWWVERDRNQDKRF
jgi:putative hydrolase of HD superfamily